MHRICLIHNLSMNKINFLNDRIFIQALCYNALLAMNCLARKSAGFAFAAPRYV